MTARRANIIVAVFSLTILPAAAACRSKAPPPAAAPAPAPMPAPAAATPAVPAAARAVTIEADGQAILRITQQGDALTVAGKGDSLLLSGTPQPNGKRKYRSADGALFAEVKSKGEAPGSDDAGFKMKTPDGKLLWKVKIAGNKIKISSEEESDHPWVLSLKHESKLKVKGPGDRELGAVTFGEGGQRVIVGDASGRELFAARTDLRSALFGVLLIDEIPMRDKAVLMAELLARGY